MRKEKNLPAQVLSTMTFTANPEDLSRIQVTREVTGILSSLNLLRDIWRARNTADVLLINGVIPEMWVAWLQTYLPGCRLKVIVTECLWSREADSLRGTIKFALMRMILQRVDRCVLYARADIPRFSEYYKLPRSKFDFVPFHNTLHPHRYTYKETPGTYIFAGGNSDRDYAPLVEAMRSLDAQCFIACGPAALKGIDLPINVYRVEANPRQFRQLLKGSAIVVAAMKGGLLRSAGQQTFLNAMRLGKPVIVTDPDGAADYIRNGETGLLVPPGDAVVLHRALDVLLRDAAEKSCIGRNAQEASAGFTTQNTCGKICAIADELLGVIAEDRIVCQ
jgi:glycosyltransferase involved in cell wall biosynthesis